MKGDDDDDELSFISLAVATANAVRYLGLDKQKNESGRDERDSRENEQQRALEQLKFVQRRLRDLDRFERRARGEKD